MMIPVIKFYDLDYRRHRSALKRILRVSGIRMNRIQQKMAIDYKHLVTRNIMTQKFAGGYAPYNTRYQKWKEQFAATTGYHVLKGDAVKAITVTKVRVYKWKSIWFSGIPSGVKDTGGKSWLYPLGSSKGKRKSIAMYMYVSEYGGNYGRGGKHPKRPVFGPSMIEYSRRGQKKRGAEYLKNVQGAWK